MANENRRLRNLFNRKKINNNLDMLDKILDDLHSDTYISDNSNEKNSERIRNNIDDEINKLRNNEFSNTSIGNISKIYSKMSLKDAQGNKQIIDSMNIFTDQAVMDNILASWMENKWIKDQDAEIDMVLKYMPKLREALLCKKDCVLSADHFSKEFASYTNIVSGNKQEIFTNRMEELKKTYNLSTNFEDWYSTAQTYGECFVYIIPYKTAFERLLNNKQNTQATTFEQAIITEGTIDRSILDVDTSTEKGRELLTAAKEIFGENVKCNLSITFDNTCILESAVKSISKIINSKSKFKATSLKETYLTEANHDAKKRNTFSPTLIPDNLEFDDSDDSAQDGVVNTKSGTENSTRIKIDVPGCIVKKLERENVIPIYIDDVCLGYYYFEYIGEGSMSFGDPNNIQYGGTLSAIGSMGNASNDELNRLREQNRDKVVNYIANQLSNKIDANFINANQDLRKELYMILKHNDIFNGISNSASGNIKVSFLPAEDVTHIKFNTDPKTKRGISDLAYSLFPAKLYSSLYITNVLGQLTRAQDKRVYYVKQNVETNISKTLLNVINQIKRGNFNARQMENLSNILNITGRFNDLIIPLSPSGDQPVQFDIMPGQQFTDNTELMAALERMAIDPTEVPFDLIEARQSLDYAIQATMSNSKLMRATYKRQDLCEEFFTDITTKIYNYEYDETETIEMTLPAPSFINMTNGSQLIEGTINYVNTLTENELATESDEVKAEYKRLSVRYHLGTHINLPLSDKFIAQAKMNVAKKMATVQDEEE